jgi:pilus assembly protein CpaC
MILKESAGQFRAMVALIFLVAAVYPGRVFGQASADPYVPQDLELLVGDIQSVKVKNLSRISITDPSIADISDAKTDEVLLMGKHAGQTVLFLWDDAGKRSVVIRVVEEDMSLVKTRISTLVQKADIKGLTLEENNYEGRVVITGEVADEDKDKLEKILGPFDAKVINLTKVQEIKDQIQIDMQITELNTSVTKNMGFQWGSGTDGQSTNDLTLKYAETLPTFDGSPGDFFKIGEFARTNSLLATVNAFIQEGKGRVLSKPRLVVVSGKEASFLVGGEIPFKTTTLNTSGGTATEETTFKQYGVNMTMTPTIKNGKIEVDMTVEVSDVDAANATGSDVAFVTRNATTHLNLDDGQTIVLAGLIKKATSEEVKRIPFISKIPIVGILFRNKSTPTPNQDTELVISLTPRILKSLPVKTAAPAVRQDAGSSSGGYAEESPSMIPRAYVQALQKRISSAINYPYEAKENGWEGTVKVSLKILRDGTLADAFVQQSSGYNIFDQDALSTAKVLAPYQPFSTDMSMDELVVVVPIVYSQKSIFQNAMNVQR